MEVPGQWIPLISTRKVRSHHLLGTAVAPWFTAVLLTCSERKVHRGKTSQPFGHLNHPHRLTQKEHMQICYTDTSKFKRITTGSIAGELEPLNILSYKHFKTERQERHFSKVKNPIVGLRHVFYGISKFLEKCSFFKIPPTKMVMKIEIFRVK